MTIAYEPPPRQPKPCIVYYKDDPPAKLLAKDEARRIAGFVAGRF
jgi:hypothetical protein